MTIETKFDIGDWAILKHDRDKIKRMIAGISIRKDSITYNLACGSSDSWHYEFEIEKEIQDNKSKAGFK